jgi:hypothetical protein
MTCRRRKKKCDEQHPECKCFHRFRFFPKYSLQVLFHNICPKLDTIRYINLLHLTTYSVRPRSLF